MTKITVKTPQLLPEDVAQFRSKILVDFFIDVPVDMQQNADNNDTTNERVDAIEIVVIDNTSRLGVVEPKVERNTKRLDAVEPVVEANTKRLDVVEPKLDTLKTNFEAHDNSNSQHGVTGENVGTENFCAPAVGGVVLLAANIAQLEQITTPDATDLESSLVLVNASKAKINEIVERLNLIITGQQAAKQMSETV